MAPCVGAVCGIHATLEEPAEGVCELTVSDDNFDLPDSDWQRLQAKALADSLQAEAELLAMLDDVSKAPQTPEDAERSRKKKEKRQRQQQKKKQQKADSSQQAAVGPSKEPAALLLESVSRIVTARPSPNCPKYWSPQWQP